MWSVSDTAEDELLCPLAIIQHGPERRLLRFEAETQEEAIQAGKDAIPKWQTAGNVFAFAREGQWRPGGPHAEAEDVVTVEFWGPGMDAPERILQPFRRAGSDGAFGISQTPQLVIGDRIVQGEDARAIVEVVLEGVQSHSAVAPLWRTWVEGHLPRDA
jgi:hypothetical protein